MARRPLLLARFAVLALLLAPRAGRADARAQLGPTEHDFGDVRRGTKVVFAFRVHNAGDSALELKSVRFSSRGMTARMPGKVAPGADGSISVEWATARMQGRVSGTALVGTNDPAAPAVKLVLHGVVRGALDVEPIPAVFLSAFRGEDARRELTLRSNQPNPVTLRLESETGRHFVSQLSPTEAGRAWRLTVRAAPGTPPGRYDEEVRIEGDDPDIGSVRIPIHVLVKEDLYANPNEIDFGDVPIARLRGRPEAARLLDQTVLVKKREGAFTVESVRSSLSAVEARVSPAGGRGGEFQIDVGLAPFALKPGSLDGTITVETDDPRFPRLTVRTRGRLVE